MIRKRHTTSTVQQVPIQNASKQDASNQELSKHISKKPINKEFKTYREEACYVLDLLESKGINIYDEDRYGGMYLHKDSGAKVKHIFESQPASNKKNSNTINSVNIIQSDVISSQTINQISVDDLSKLFGK